jgi:hypothetical protein
VNPPLHPLVVHAAVVFVPVAMLLVITAVSWRRVRVQVGAVGAGMALAGAVAIFVAHRTGTALAAVVGTPYEHMAWADPGLAAAIVFGVLAGGWYALLLLSRRPNPHRALRPVARWTGVLAAIAGVVATVFTVLLGHSGASSVWTGITAAAL